MNEFNEINELMDIRVCLEVYDFMSVAIETEFINVISELDDDVMSLSLQKLS